MDSASPQPDHWPDRAGRLGAGAWRWLESPLVLRTILALLLALALLAGVFPQTEPQAGMDEARWRLEARARWGRAFDIAETIGALDVYDSAPFRLLLAALGLVSLVRLTSLWAPRWSLPPRRGLVARSAARSGGDDEARRPEDAVRAEGLHLTPLGARDGLRFAAITDTPSRHALAGLLFLGVVLLLVAGFVGGRWSWEGASVALALGEETVLEPATDLRARLDLLEVRGSGAPTQRLVADLSLRQDGAGTDAAQTTARVSAGQPATVGGLRLYMVGQGPVVRVEAEAAGGERLRLTWLGGPATTAETVRVRFAAVEHEQIVALTGADRLLEMVYYSSLPGEGIDEPVVHAVLRDASGGEILAEEFLTSDGVLDDGRVQVRLAAEYFVRVRAEREPELPLAVLGGLALLAGGVGQALWPPRRGWLVTAEDGESARHLLLAPEREWAERLWRGLAGEHE